jgi:CO dehydrogenase nickel-insertion accessory protein CooC1
LLGELEANGRVVVFDMEAGVGTLLRMHSGHVDVVLVVAEPTAKSIEIARRMAEIGAERARVVVVANKVRGDADVDAIRRGVGEYEIVAVPEDPAVSRADDFGVAPVDAAPNSEGVRALAALAQRLRA